MFNINVLILNYYVPLINSTYITFRQGSDAILMNFWNYIANRETLGPFSSHFWDANIHLIIKVFARPLRNQ